MMIRFSRPSIFTAVFFTLLVLAALPFPAHAGPLRDLITGGLEAALPKGSAIKRDIAYGPAKDQKIDLYLPPNPKDAPIILMVHGGGWKRGDKEARGVIDNKLKHWLPQGFIFASVNYRMLPEADPLIQAQDIAAALAFVQKRAASWGGDADKIITMGHSAGAHLVALLAANPDHAAQMGAMRWRGTVVLDSGVMNVPEYMGHKHPSLYDNAFGKNPDFWAKASPFHQLTAKAVPIMLVCSLTRKDRPCDQAEAFAARAQEMGMTFPISKQYKRHGQINSELGEPGPYTGAVDTFIGEVLGK